MEKLILTDCDGVLLNWEWAFNVWMEQKGYKIDPATPGHAYSMHIRYNIEIPHVKELIRQFNESAAIGFLPPLRDAVYYVSKLAAEGFKFHVITSLSLDASAGKLRRRNLEKLFGPVFDEVVCLDTGADKTQALEKYAGSGLVWLEDKLENALEGQKLGLTSILVEHGHNMEHEYDIPTCSTWESIYKLIQFHYR